MGGGVVCAAARGLAAGGRLAGRPARPPARVRGRRAAVRGGLAGLCAVRQRGATDRGARPAGRRRRAAGSGQPGLDQRHLSARRARCRLRHLGGLQRRDVRPGSGAGRLPDRPALLGLGLRGEPAGGGGRRRDRLDLRAREQAGRAARAHRRARGAAGHAGAGRHRLLLHRGARARVGRAPGAGRWCGRRREPGRLLPGRTRAGQADAAALAAAPGRFRCGQPAHLAALCGARWRAVLPAAQPDPGAGDVGDQRRRGAAALHPGDVRALALGRQAGGPARRGRH